MPKTIEDLNRDFIAAVTEPSCTREEHKAAVHALLTSPLRTDGAVCHCLDCDPSCAICGGGGRPMTDPRFDAKLFMLAGRAVFTATNATGEHLTFRISLSKKSGRFFASVLSGPNNGEDYTYIGELNPETGFVALTPASRFADDARCVQVIRWLCKLTWLGAPLPEGYSMMHSGFCGRCAKELTHPLSLVTGFGPECAAKMGLDRKAYAAAKKFEESRVRCEEV